MKRLMIPTTIGVGVGRAAGRTCGIIRFASPTDGELDVALDLPSIGQLEAQLSAMRSDLIAAAVV